MSEYVILKCDQCQKEQPEREALGWIETQPAGLDVRTVSDKPLRGTFCSRECLVAYLSPDGSGIGREPRRRES